MKNRSEDRFNTRQALVERIAERIRRLAQMQGLGDQFKVATNIRGLGTEVAFFRHTGPGGSRTQKWRRFGMVRIVTHRRGDLFWDIGMDQKWEVFLPKGTRDVVNAIMNGQVMLDELARRYPEKYPTNHALLAS